MKVGFFSSRMPFEADTSENGICGGSELALINMTREWKRNNPNDTVIVYNNNSGKHLEYNGVKWKTLLDFQLNVRSFDLDVLISLREPEIFSLPYIDSKLKILWSEDNMEERSLQELKNNKYSIKNIDKIFVISQFAYNDIKKSFPDSDIQIIRNGYNKDWIQKYTKKPIAVYASTPFRGLNLLSKFWPIIFEKCLSLGVETKLKIFGGMSLYGQQEGEFNKLYKTLSEQDGVLIYKSIPQKILYEELKSASVMLYPNTHTETGCMAVTEALANNLWIVTTNKGALGEQVINGKNGYLIDGDPNSEEYEDLFISNAVTSLIKHPIPNNEGLIFSWSEQAKKMRKFLEDEL
jgi:glycosyltransferase involved in cell wall biosynthesis